MAASAIFFIACGDGEMIELTAPDRIIEFEEINTYFENKALKDIKDSINRNPPQESSSSQPPVVQSSQSTTQSSSGGSVIVSSSSRSTTQSSSGGSVIVSSSSRPTTQSSSTQTIAGKCGENNPKSDFTCSWNKTTGLTPDYVLKPANSTAPSGCTVEWSYAYGDEMPMLPNDFRFQCNALGSEGVKAKGSTAYALFANLTCSDGTHTNKCTPEVMAGIAPVMVGTCKWVSTGDRDLPVIAGVVETSEKKGAKAIGVTLEDKNPAKICAGTTLKTTYNGAAWSNTPAVGTYSGVQIEAANCPAFEVPPVKCPDLKVTSGGCISWDGKTNVNIGPDDCIDLNFTVAASDTGQNNSGWANGLYLICSNATAIGANGSDCNRLLRVNGGIVNTKSNFCEQTLNNNTMVGFNATGGKPKAGTNIYMENISAGAVKGGTAKYECVTPKAAYNATTNTATPGYTDGVPGICNGGVVLLKEFECDASYQKPGQGWASLCGNNIVVKSHECPSGVVKTSSCPSEYGIMSYEGGTPYEGNFTCKTKWDDINWN